MLIILKDIGRSSLTIQSLIGKSDVGDILDVVLNDRLQQQHLGLNECIRLIKSNDICSIGLTGNILRQRLYGNTATFVNNIILNYTNVCITNCKFCAFYRPPGHAESYTLSIEEIVRRVILARNMFGITQVLIQGGHNPTLKIEYYEDAFKKIKVKCPEVGIHGLSAAPGHRRACQTATRPHRPSSASREQGVPRRCRRWHPGLHLPPLGLDILRAAGKVIQ